MDWTGTDTLRLELFVDHEPLFKGVWEDANTGERLPGLPMKLRETVAKKNGGNPTLDLASTGVITFVA